MSAQMKDNPKHEKGLSRRRKIIESFEINLGRCILCGICVDVCNFDAIEMSHEYELSKYQRNANRVGLNQLLDMGVAYQNKLGWTPKQPKKNSGVPLPPKQSEDSS
jgi:NADH-quinone oxidoreductase subunit I